MTKGVRFSGALLFFVFVLVCAHCVFGQGPLATVTGRIVDPNSASILEASITARNVDTGVEVQTETNEVGIYYFSGLEPGRYEFTVSKNGFAVIRKPDVVLHVADTISMNFGMKVGAVAESIVVQGGTPLVNTTNGSVSTVVDRNFVENMPLNGRSFQDLILLTPGVVTISPQTAQTLGAQGEFSVNGQRTESNYYIVDGVSGNLGVSPGAPAGAGAGGNLPAATALGTTQALVSVDALQEFRVQSSTYSAEYGRSPGGQFSFVTRSGTDQWHGSAFDYVRNNIFDANDWFNNYFQQAEPALRQNDFGGTLGGPVHIPSFRDAKNKTFFFMSYEGLRIRQPQPSALSDVPTIAVRSSAPAELQPVLNAFPQPSCPRPGSVSTCRIDLSNGLGNFVDTWSNPSSLDSGGVRVDHSITDRARIFVRFSDTQSNSANRSSAAPSQMNATTFHTDTYTLGITNIINAKASNEFRVNYSSNRAEFSSHLDSFGGAQPADLARLQGIDKAASPAYFLRVAILYGDLPAEVAQAENDSFVDQWNLLNTADVHFGRHDVRAGVDYRRIASDVSGSNPFVFYNYFSEQAVATNHSNFAIAESNARAFPVYTNLSLFAQDEVRLTPKLALSLGLRWELNPPPGVSSGLLPYTVAGLSKLSTMTLAPEGTPLWKTTWYNFAPRLGAAYILRQHSRFETVIRGGAGLFYDTGQQAGSFGFQGPGYTASSLRFGSAFPVPEFSTAPTIILPPPQPYGSVYAFSEHLQSPYTIQSNVNFEQALGNSQVLTLGYIGAFSRKLLEQNNLNVGPVNSNFSQLLLFQNGLTADYNSLQVRFERRLSRGLQILASYALSHCLDYGSQNYAYPYSRGNCDYDVRHNESSAVSYEFPNVTKRRVLREILNNWRVDNRLGARSAFPVPLNGPCVYNAATEAYQCLGLNVVQGQPTYIYGAACTTVYQSGLDCPGGRAINPLAVSLPTGCSPFFCPPGTPPGNAPRNFARGFSSWQMDLALSRNLAISENARLQFRAEAFNLLNHPNFGAINSNYCSVGPGSVCTFGQATGTLAQSLSIMNPLYQMGGPRSLQFGLKAIF